MPSSTRVQQIQRDTVTAALLDMAGAREAYQTDATFRAQIDMLVIGLPAMVRALAEEVPGRQAAIQAAIDLAARTPLSAEAAMKLIRETGVMLIDRAEGTDPRQEPPPVEQRRCVAHGVIACTTCWAPAEGCDDCETTGRNCRAHGGR